MSFDEEWRSLGVTWRDGSADPTPLARRLRNQRLRMMIMIGLELTMLVLCSVQLIELAVRPKPDRWVGWAWAMLAGVWSFQGMLIYVRRGQWRQPTLTPAALIEHTLSRVRTAIRLAWLNVAVMILFGLFGLVFAIMEWRERNDHRPFIVPSILAFGFVVTFSIGVRWYLHRQCRTIAAVRQLAEELVEPDSDPPDVAVAVRADPPPCDER